MHRVTSQLVQQRRNLPAFEEEDEGCPCGAAGLACFFSQSSPSSRGPRAIKRSWGEGNDEQNEGASNGEEEARRETSSSLLAGQDMAILEEARDRVSRASQGEMRM